MKYDSRIHRARGRFQPVGNKMYGVHYNFPMGRNWPKARGYEFTLRGSGLQQARRATVRTCARCLTAVFGAQAAAAQVCESAGSRHRQTQRSPCAWHGRTAATHSSTSPRSSAARRRCGRQSLASLPFQSSAQEVRRWRERRPGSDARLKFIHQTLSFYTED